MTAPALYELSQSSYSRMFKRIPCHLQQKPSPSCLKIRNICRKKNTSSNCLSLVNKFPAAYYVLADRCRCKHLQVGLPGSDKGLKWWHMYTCVHMHTHISTSTHTPYTHTCIKKEQKTLLPYKFEIRQWNCTGCLHTFPIPLSQRKRKSEWEEDVCW